MTIIDLNTVTLAKGAHSDPADGLCVMEAVALFAGEAHSDHPSCASPILTRFGIELNDRLATDKRQHLIPLVPQIVGTRNDGLDKARGYIALDWLIRTYTPAFFDLAGLTAEAQELRNLRRIVDIDAARATEPVVAAAWAAARAAARDAAWAAAGDAAGAAVDAAGDAAGAAARAAARDAAWAAARAAARDAARDAAWAAARAAARAAAWDAAWAAAGAAARAAARDAARAATEPVVDAARAVLAPTVTELQDSAIDLFALMIGGK